MKNLFISHSWKNHADYDNLKRMLEDRGYFLFDSHEVNRDKPINSINEIYIKSKLKEKIIKSDIFIGLAGVYATHSDWMTWEIKTAYDNNIPIIGIKPHGNSNISAVVQQYAKEIANWNTESIVTAIRKHSKSLFKI